ncbi:MAG: hypothetical protein PHT36_00495 [Patescibacteria group bacterium]|nr:hypothetical protein [Patescibacteria group bacterium]
MSELESHSERGWEEELKDFLSLAEKELRKNDSTEKSYEEVYEQSYKKALKILEEDYRNTPKEELVRFLAGNSLVAENFDTKQDPIVSGQSQAIRDFLEKIIERGEKLK